MPALDSQQILSKPAPRSSSSYFIDVLTLLSAFAVLVAFRFLPWVALDSGTTATGADLFSNTSAPNILLIPAIALAACLLTLWSFLSPSVRRGAAGVLALC